MSAGLPPAPKAAPAPCSGISLEHDEPGTHVLVYSLADNLVLSLEVVDAVLLVGESAAALGAHEGVLLAALVLQVSVQVVVPVVGTLEQCKVSYYWEENSSKRRN